MKKLYFFVLAWIMLVSISCVHAQIISYYEIENRINKDFLVETKIKLIFNGSIDEFNFILPDNARDVSFSSKDNIVCENIIIDKRNALHCIVKERVSNKTGFEVTFKKRNIAHAISAFKFSESYIIPYDTKKLFAIIYLPQGASLAEGGNKSYTPAQGKTSTDGKHIMVYWQFNDIEKNSMLKFSLLYTMPLMKQPTYNIMIALLTFFVVVVMVVFGTFLIKGKGKRSAEIIMPILTKDERMLVEILKKHNGEASQKILVRELDFSKAKVSRILKALKERGIVDVQPLSGRENKVILLIKY
ncbi:MAG TPA: winged helix-turn-helix transcriptional regulator [Candidatus Aenigmarchaeota archaeon]|nr:MAG: hypothetical protein DRP03_03065 [Candidatus Aenigmarchaeota archaeon]HDD46228.1 winged helix-turn-helix transcriptional regulator [Candidatus Aenigmarchaeota archaeon]